MLNDHPDFVVTIGGKDITKETLSWTLNDREEGMSSIEVRIDNKDMKHSGAFKIDDEVCLRFGTQSEMAPKVSMKIKKFSEHYGRDGLYINVSALDCTEKLSGKTGGGHHKKGKPSDIAEELLKKAELTVNKKAGKEEDLKKQRKCTGNPFPSGRDVQQEILYNISHISDNKGGGGSESDSKSKDIAQGAMSILGSELGRKHAENKAKNVGNQAKSNTITARMQLIGVPMLKAKAMVTIQGVGDEGSGDWYVKDVSHSWSPQGGYNTSASLLRQDKKSGGGNPVILYAEIYEKNKVYMGPRKMGEENQGTFTFGDGKNLISFTWEYNDQATKSAGKDFKGKAVNIRKPKKYVIDASAKGEDGAGGGDTATA